MKKQKQSLLIQVWENYEFYLYIPDEITRDSKPFIFYYYVDAKTNKSVRIKKFIGQNKGDKKAIQNEAKTAIVELITLLKGNYNPVNKTYNELKITPLSPIKDCIQFYIESSERAQTLTSITFKRLKGIKIIMMHFTAYLTKQSLLNTKSELITNIDIKDFLDSKAFERTWGKVSYNSYRTDIGTFFNFLMDLNIITRNPVRRSPKKVTKYDSSRFKVFELEELKHVANLLANDTVFLGLHVAAKILFKYNIRPLEITRIQIKDINWEKSTLTLPPHKTKNGNEATFSLDEEILILFKVLTGNYASDDYIFCRGNKPSSKQMSDDYFGQRWRTFRKKHNLPYHLKFYALKHSSNYYDIENGANYEEIRQRNRHSNLQITTLYIKERLFKNIIKPSTSNNF